MADTTPVFESVPMLSQADASHDACIGSVQARAVIEAGIAFSEASDACGCVFESTPAHSTASVSATSAVRDVQDTRTVFESYPVQTQATCVHGPAAPGVQAREARELIQTATEQCEPEDGTSVDATTVARILGDLRAQEARQLIAQASSDQGASCSVFESLPCASPAEAGAGRVSETIVDRPTCFESTPAKSSAHTTYGTVRQHIDSDRFVFESSPLASRADAHSCQAQDQKHDAGAGIYESKPQASQAAAVYASTATSDANGPSVFESAPQSSRAAVSYSSSTPSVSEVGIYESAPAPSSAHATSKERTQWLPPGVSGVFESQPKTVPVAARYGAAEVENDWVTKSAPEEKY